MVGASNACIEPETLIGIKVPRAQNSAHKVVLIFGWEIEDL